MCSRLVFSGRAHTLPKPQAVSHWIRRKNSQLNKRRPPARPTHSAASHTWTRDHTHTMIIHTSLPCVLVSAGYPSNGYFLDAAFDKSALLALCTVSLTLAFPPRLLQITLAKESIVSRAYEDKVFLLLCQHIALCHQHSGGGSRSSPAIIHREEQRAHLSRRRLYISSYSVSFIPAY